MGRTQVTYSPEEQLNAGSESRCGLLFFIVRCVWDGLVTSSTVNRTRVQCQKGLRLRALSRHLGSELQCAGAI